MNNENNNTSKEKKYSIENALAVLFNETPYIFTLWDMDFKIVDCNNTTKEFYGLNSKQEYINNVNKFIPEFQPDGTNSLEKRKANFEKCIELGTVAYELTKQNLEGKQLSVYTVLKKIKIENIDFIASYQFDLRFIDTSRTELLKRDTMLSAVNKVAELLLSSIDSDFSALMHQVLKILGTAARSDRCYIWENYHKENDPKIYVKQVFEWVNGVDAVQDMEVIQDVSWESTEPMFYKTLSKGKKLNVIVSEMESQEGKALLEAQDIKTVLWAPITYQNNFWGFIGFDNCHSEELWEPFEEEMLATAGLFVAATIQKHNLLNSLEHSENRFQDIAISCKQVIWETNKEGVFTYMSDAIEDILGIPAKELIGKKIFELVNPDDAKNISLLFREALVTPKSYSNFYTRPNTNMINNNKEVWLQNTFTTFYDPATNEIIGYRGFALDVTEAKTIEAEIIKIAATANAANEAKSRFLTNMSHEVRTPLNAILGIAYLALKNQEIDPQTKNYLKKIQFSANNLLAMINDVLDISKLETGSLEFISANFSITEIITSIKEQVIASVQQKKLKISVSIHPDIPNVVVGDSLKISQAIINLLDNAIKFTDKGSIELKVTLEEIIDNSVAKITFTVTDTGIGIAQEKHKEIYDAFVQVDTSLTRKYAGIGLGLSITKRIVELMNGTIGMESKLGEGSSFYFTVPLLLSQCDRKSLAADDADADKDMDDDSLMTDEQLYEINKGKAILLVEDNELNREVIVTILEDYGLSIDTAANGIEAIEAAKNKKYNIIFMDIQMPLMDGLEATREIRKLPGMESVPIIALTAHARESDYKKSIEAGMNDHISKPIKPLTFLNVIKKWI